MPDGSPRKPKSRTERATLLLKKARKQAALCKTGVEIGSDDVAITFAFQSFENAIRAAGKATGEFAETTKHWDLSEQARELATEGYLETDVSDRLDELNAGRKKAAYGYEEEFEHSDFEEILGEVDKFITEVAELIRRGGKKLKAEDEKS